MLSWQPLRIEILVGYTFEETERIRELIDDIARAQDEAMLESVGIIAINSSSEGESSD